jgi:hypothetical protein
LNIRPRSGKGCVDTVTPDGEYQQKDFRPLKVLMKMTAAAAVVRWGLLFSLLLPLIAPTAYSLEAAPEPSPSFSTYADLKQTVQAALAGGKKKPLECREKPFRTTKTNRVT